MLVIFIKYLKKYVYTYIILISVFKFVCEIFVKYLEFIVHRKIVPTIEIM